MMISKNGCNAKVDKNTYTIILTPASIDSDVKSMKIFRESTTLHAYIILLLASKQSLQIEL